MVLRFFEGRRLSEVGTVLGTSEGAARKRVNRAVEKLRRFFTRRGIILSATALTTAISAHSIQAAPAGLVASISAAAAKGAAVSSSTLTLVTGVLKLMAWTKAKTAIVAGAAVLLAAGTITITVKNIREHQTYPWQDKGEGLHQKGANFLFVDGHVAWFPVSAYWTGYYGITNNPALRWYR